MKTQMAELIPHIFLKNKSLYVDFPIYYNSNNEISETKEILETKGVVENKIIEIVMFGRSQNITSKIVIKNCVVNNLVKLDIQDYPVTLENNTFFD